MNIEGEAQRPEGDRPEEDEDEINVVIEDNDDDDAGDGRLSAEDREDGGSRDETPEQRRARRKEERQRKKQTRTAYEEEERVLIRSLTETNEQLMRRLGELGQKVDAGEIDKIRNGYSYWERRAQDAVRAKARAIELNDGAGVIAAEEAQREAQGYMGHFGRAYHERTTIMQQQEEAAQQQGPNPVVLSHIRTFKTRFPWYNLNGGDENSDLVLELDDEIVKDGFEPTSKEYWTELEKRMRQELDPSLFARADGEEDRPRRRERQPVREERRERRGPPVADSSGRAVPGRRTVHLPAELVKNAKEAGMWDDPDARKRIINNYVAEQKRQRGEA